MLFMQSPIGDLRAAFHYVEEAPEIGPFCLLVSISFIWRFRGLVKDSRTRQKWPRGAI